VSVVKTNHPKTRKSQLPKRRRYQIYLKKLTVPNIILV